jgi:hypothetical protein
MRKYLLLLAALLLACASEPLPRPQPSIGYPSVEAALADLKSKPGVEVAEQNGWTIVADPAEKTVWSFAPSGHVAYPAAVKRATVEKDGKVWIEMKVLCQAEKAPCDALVEEFKQLNEQIRQSMQRYRENTQ